MSTCSIWSPTLLSGVGQWLCNRLLVYSRGVFALFLILCTISGCVGTLHDLMPQSSSLCLDEDAGETHFAVVWSLAVVWHHPFIATVFATQCRCPQNEVLSGDQTMWTFRNTFGSFELCVPGEEFQQIAESSMHKSFSHCMELWVYLSLKGCIACIQNTPMLIYLVSAAYIQAHQQQQPVLNHVHQVLANNVTTSHNIFKHTWLSRFYLTIMHPTYHLVLDELVTFKSMHVRQN